MLDAPVGRVTMLFTDIEGSTQMARALGGRWADVLAAHHSIVGGAIRTHDGFIEQDEGDAFVAVFSEPDEAVSAAVEAQRELRRYAWPADVGEVGVRMGVHVGHVDRAHGQLVGLEIHRAARVGAAAAGGQILLTGEARASLRADLACEDLGSHRLKDFPEPTRLFHVAVLDPADTFPPPRTLDVRPTNLPATDVSMLGRDAELDAVVTAVATGAERVVTICGLGGAGKTTLALAAGHVLLDEHPGGVWLVRGESLQRSDELTTAIAEALWVRVLPGRDPMEAVVDRLASGPVLLVLDNLEQIDGAADVVDALVTRSTVRLLVTSRSSLGIRSERVLPLEPLSVGDAVALLLERADAAGASIEASDPGVVELCTRLDGSPLAIELVAPQLRLLSPAEALDRFDVVAAIERPGRPDRHRSVRAAVASSLDLLSEEELVVFSRLGVFVGPAALPVIEAVCGDGVDVLGALQALLDNALLRRVADGFVMPANVHHVAAANLARSADEGRTRRAHAEAMIVVGERASTAAASRADLRAELTMRGDGWAATEWARTADPPKHRRLVQALGSSWALAGQIDRTMRELEHALDGDVPPTERGELLRLRAYVRNLLRQGPEAEAEATEALSLLAAAPPPLRGRAFVVLAQARRVSGRLDAAAEAAAAAVDVWRPAGDAAGLQRALCELAYTYMVGGDLEAAARALTEAEAATTDDDAPQAVAIVSSLRGEWSTACGDPCGAVEAHLRSLEHDETYVAWQVASLAVALEELGDPVAALELGVVAHAICTERGIDADSLIEIGDGLPAALARARGAAGEGAASEAEQRGRDLPSGRRVLRARELGSACLERVRTS